MRCWIIIVTFVMLSAIPLPARATTVQPSQAVAFTSLPHGTVKGIPRDVRAESRIVGVFSGHRLAVAPTRNGNFCEGFSGAFMGCRVRPGFEGKPSPPIGATVIGAPQNIDAIAGDVVTSPDHQLYVFFRDGTSERLPLTYVSQPIRAGFFWFTVPNDRRHGAHAPTRLELRSRTKIVQDWSIPPIRSVPKLDKQ